MEKLILFCALLSVFLSIICLEFNIIVLALTIVLEFPSLAQISSLLFSLLKFLNALLLFLSGLCNFTSFSIQLHLGWFLFSLFHQYMFKSFLLSDDRLIKGAVSQDQKIYLKVNDEKWVFFDEPLIFYLISKFECTFSQSLFNLQHLFETRLLSPLCQLTPSVTIFIIGKNPRNLTNNGFCKTTSQTI